MTLIITEELTQMPRLAQLTVNPKGIYTGTPPAEDYLNPKVPESAESFRPHRLWQSLEQMNYAHLSHLPPLPPSATVTS